MFKIDNTNALVKVLIRETGEIIDQVSSLGAFVQHGPYYAYVMYPSGYEKYVFKFNYYNSGTKNVTTLLCKNPEENNSLHATLKLFDVIGDNLDKNLDNYLVFDANILTITQKHIYNPRMGYYLDEEHISFKTGEESEDDESNINSILCKYVLSFSPTNIDIIDKYVSPRIENHNLPDPEISDSDKLFLAILTSNIKNKYDGKVIIKNVIKVRDNGKFIDDIDIEIEIPSLLTDIGSYSRFHIAFEYDINRNSFTWFMSIGPLGSNFFYKPIGNVHDQDGNINEDLFASICKIVEDLRKMTK